MIVDMDGDVFEINEQLEIAVGYDEERNKTLYRLSSPGANDNEDEQCFVFLTKIEIDRIKEFADKNK